MSFLDKMSVNSEEQDQDLLKLWDKTNKKLGIIRLFVYLTLSIGVGLQVLFIVLNYNNNIIVKPLRKEQKTIKTWDYLIYLYKRRSK
jgi:ABC-type proline/glycine betaine transport system permease subunit